MSGLSLKRNAVMIDVACNDPDNGAFAHRAEMIQIGTDFIELELEHYPAPRFAELDGAVRFSGKRWPVVGAKYGVGNWCWNGYWFEIPVAVDFLCWLHQRRKFSLSCGEERIFNRWRVPDPFGENDRDFLWRMLGKPSTFLHCDHNDFPRERRVVAVSAENGCGNG
jgi:hypothetical protein